MKIKKIRYNKKTNIYYKGDKPDQDIINKSLLYLKESKKANFNLIKKGNGRKVFKDNLGLNIYYFKKYSYRKFDKKIKNLIRKPSAYRALKTSYSLLEKNIPVVQPVLAVTYKHNYFTYDSIYVTKDFGGCNFQQFVAFKEYDNIFKKKIIQKLAILWSDLYNENIINYDPNLGSILINKKKHLDLSLVDVDNIKFQSKLNKNDVIYNLSKFNAHSYIGLKKLDGKKLNCFDKNFFLKEIHKNTNILSKLKLKILLKSITQKSNMILDSWD